MYLEYMESEFIVLDEPEIVEETFELPEQLVKIKEKHMKENAYLERHYRIKDFSNLLPGHGGVLDRIDSVMFIAPFAYMMFLLIL